jgi:hypothetical protein
MRPSSVEGCIHSVSRTPTLTGSCTTDDGHPAHPRKQRLGHMNLAVRFLEVLEDRDQRSARPRARIRSAYAAAPACRCPDAPARLHAPRLEVAEVAAGGNLAIGCCPGSQTSRSYGLRRREAEIAAAQCDRPIRQFQLRFRISSACDVSARAPRRILRAHQLHQLDLLELMLADHAAGVAAVAAGLARKHGVWQTTNLAAGPSASTISSRNRFVTGTSAVGIR